MPLPNRQEKLSQQMTPYIVSHLGRNGHAIIIIIIIMEFAEDSRPVSHCEGKATMDG